jgi:hypothetical protein
VTADKFLSNVELTAKLADLILEELTKRLNKLEAVARHKTLGDTTNVVVGLDSLRGALERDTLDNVWVKSTLQEPLNLTGTSCLNLSGFRLENINKLATDELALLLRVMLSLQTGQELLRSIDHGKINAKLLLENFFDKGRLVQAKTAVIDEHSVEAITNSFCQ